MAPRVSPKILVVDRNQAFATMLKEMLEQEGGYRVETAHTGSDALARLRRQDFDLTIADMDLEPEDMDYRDLVRQVREVRPTMRLMLIPLMGESLPPEAAALDIQGALSKPFFADDLLPGIQDALAKRVRPPRPARLAPARPAALQPTPTPSPSLATRPAAGVQPVLSDLVRETNADAVLLVSNTAGAERVIAHLCTLDQTGIETLAGLSITATRAAQAAAHFLGQPDEPFEHNMFESKSLRLYILAFSENLLLVIVAPPSTPLGTIRYSLRRAGRELADLTLT